MKNKINQNNINLTFLIIIITILMIFSVINIIYQNKIINSYKEENNKLTAKLNEITGELIYSYNDRDKELSDKITYILKNYQINKAGFIKYLDYFEDMPFTYPLKDNSMEVIKGFGWYINKEHNTLGMRQGIVIRSKISMAVISTAHGVVSKIKRNVLINDNYEDYYYYSDIEYECSGFAVEISHKFGFTTVYSNLENIIIKEGDKVQKGQVIGYLDKNNIYNSFLFYMILLGDAYITNIKGTNIVKINLKDPYPFLLYE